MKCIRCKIREVDVCLGYEGYTCNLSYPKIKICCNCRLTVFPKEVLPSVHYGKFIVAYSRKHEEI